MKTAISLPDELFAAVERAAKRLGISRSELFRRAIRRYLADERQRGVTEALNEVYAEEPEASRVDPLLDRLQSGSLPREES